MSGKRFPVSERPLLRVTARSGSVTITGEARDDILVEKGEGTVAVDGVEVASRSGKVKVRCPEGTAVFVGSGSGEVELRGRLGDARVTTRSGTISAEAVGHFDARTGSGTIEVGDCDGDCDLHSGSGSVRVGAAGEATIATGSGSVHAGAVRGAHIRAGSGRVEVGLSEAGPVDVEAHSGSVTVTVPAGVRPAAKLRAGSGTVRCDCPEGEDCPIRVKTSSGAITVIEH